MALNEVFLTGTLGQDPELQLGTGTPCATARVCVEEVGPTGQVFKTWIPLEAWGKSAEPLAELHGGDLVLVRGKLRWRKSGEKQGMLVVSAWSVQPLINLAASVAE